MRMRTWTAAALLALAGAASLRAQTPPPAADPMPGAEPQGTGEFVDDAVKASEEAQQEDRRKVDEMVKDSVKETDEAPSGADAAKQIPPTTPGP